MSCFAAQFMRKSPFALLVCALAVFAGAQAQVELRPRPAPASSPRIVTLDVSVTDAHGKPINGLSAADFALTEDGRPRKITSFTPVQDGIPQRAGQPEPRVILFFYHSGSDRESGVRSSLINVLEANNGSLKAPTMIVEGGIIGEAGDMGMLHNYTRDGRALVRALRNKHPSLAPIGGAIHSGGGPDWMKRIAEASERVPGHKTLIWIQPEPEMGISNCHPATDLNRALPDWRYRLDQCQAKHMTVWSNLLFKAQMTVDELVHPEETDVKNPLTGEIVGHTEDSYLDMAHTLKMIHEIEPGYGSAVIVGCNLLPFAPETGGEMAIDQGDSIQKDIERAMSRAANYYAISYSSTNLAFDGAFRKINVKIDRPNAKIYVRNGYYAEPDHWAPTIQCRY